MAVLAVQQIATSGLNPAFVAAAGGGDEFPNIGREFLEVINGGGGSINVTLVTTGTVDGEPIADRVVAVPNGERRRIGPFPTGTYNAADGNVDVSYSGVTSVTVGVFRL